MTLNILIVDDSQFFQRLLSEIINEHPKFTVVGVANNGREAIEKVKSLKPDIVTMDYEMPMMDGVTAVRSIMAENPLPILMLSSMSFSGAKITIDALEAGAADFMTKNFAEISGKGAAIKKRLYDTLLALGKSDRFSSNQSAPDHIVAEKKEIPKTAPVPKPVSQVAPPKADAPLSEKPKIVIIGASTGGPAALSEVLKHIPARFPYPIIVVQHMPQNFTLAFSQRLNKQCQLDIKEAEQGDRLSAGKVFVAPGGKQLTIDKHDISKINITDPKIEMTYKPSVDVSFASIANAYGKHTLAIVLTGMGSDGCDGARLLRQKSAPVWTQSKESCVIYGMPMAIDKANLSTASLPLDKISQRLCKL